ncbi:MAG: phosphomannomutase/phosphoglucomutase [Spirochaetia bacterium]
MSVFHAYDIRGIFGTDLDLDLTKNIAGAIARFSDAKTYMIGYDARLHSQEMYQTIAQGLTEWGKDVTGIGLCSTPLLHFSQIKKHIDCGIMVTASHNPPPYHGLKLFDALGGSVSYEKGLKTIEQMTYAARPGRDGEKGRFSQTSYLNEYIDFLVQAARGRSFTAKTVIDVSNGSAGHIFRRLGRELGLTFRIINEEPDGNFPNHFPNPLLAQSREQVAQAIKQEKADLGIVLDGDGDRIIVVDEKGRPIENYFLSALIAEELLKEHPGAGVVYDLISSKVLPDYIARHGGTPVVSRVGYTFIYDTMVAQGAVFGCETSGHVYFKVDDRYYTESAAYALVLLLGLLEKKKKPLSELVAPLADCFYQAPELNVEVKDKQAVLSLIEKTYAEAVSGKLDGISVEYPDYWFNVRPSNTEPLLRVRLEATSKVLAMEKYRQLKELISSGL